METVDPKDGLKECQNKESLNKIADALGLMNSMILSGEKHSDQSTKAFYEAEKALSELSEVKESGNEVTDEEIRSKVDKLLRDDFFLQGDSVREVMDKFTKWLRSRLQQPAKDSDEQPKMSVKKIKKDIIKEFNDYWNDNSGLWSVRECTILSLAMDKISQFSGLRDVSGKDSKPTDEQIEKWAEKEASRFYFPKRSDNERVRMADFIFAVKHFYKAMQSGQIAEYINQK